MAGYDDGKSMHDDDMIDHAETITTSCDEIVTALAKAQVLDTIIAMVKGARPLNFDEEFARSLSQTIDQGVRKILESEPAAGRTSSHSSNMRP